MERVYGWRWDILGDVKSSLYFALGNLVLKAWEKKENGRKGGVEAEIETPRFIEMLRSQRKKHDIHHHDQESATREPRDSLSNPLESDRQWKMQTGSGTGTGVQGSYARHRTQDNAPIHPSYPSSQTHGQPSSSQYENPSRLPLASNMQVSEPWLGLAPASFLDLDLDVSDGLMPDVTPLDWEYRQLVVDGGRVAGV